VTTPDRAVIAPEISFIVLSCVEPGNRIAARAAMP
jgi:hypothetical protein